MRSAENKENEVKGKRVSQLLLVSRLSYLQEGGRGYNAAAARRVYEYSIATTSDCALLGLYHQAIHILQTRQACHETLVIMPRCFHFTLHACLPVSKRRFAAPPGGVSAARDSASLVQDNRLRLCLVDFRHNNKSDAIRAPPRTVYSLS